MASMDREPQAWTGAPFVDCWHLPRIITVTGLLSCGLLWVQDQDTSYQRKVFKLHMICRVALSEPGVHKCVCGGTSGGEGAGRRVPQ